MSRVNRLAAALTLLLASGVFAGTAVGADETIVHGAYDYKMVVPQSCGTGLSCAQVFVPSQDGVVSSVSLPLAHGGGTAPLLVEIRSFDGRSPGDEVLGRAEVDAAALPKYESYKDPGLTTIVIPPDSRRRLTAGKAYALVVSTAAQSGIMAGLGDTTEYFWFDEKDGSFSAGTQVLEGPSPGVWKAYAADFAFSIQLEEAKNTPPTIAPIGGQTVEEDAPEPLVVSVGVTDENLSSVTLTASSSNQALVRDGTTGGVSDITVTRTATGFELSIRPVPDANGILTITLTADDGEFTDTVSFPLNIKAVNDKPVIKTAFDDLDLDEAEERRISFSIMDPDGTNGLTVTADTSRPDLLPVVQITGTGESQTLILTVAEHVEKVETAAVTVKVSDRELEDSATFQVTVHPVNDKPEITGLGDLTAKEDGAMKASFKVRDEETPASELNVEIKPDDTRFFTGVPSIEEQNGQIEVTWPLAKDEYGTTWVTVEVTDGHNATTSQRVRLEIVPTNDPPEFVTVPDNVTMDEDQVTTVEVLASDPDGADAVKGLTLTVASSNPSLLPSEVDPGGSGIKVDGGSGQWTLTLKPRPDQSGTATVSLTVNDGQYLQSASFQVNVKAVNDRPTIKQVEKIVRSVGTGAFTVPLEIADAETFTHALEVDATEGSAGLLSQVQPQKTDAFGWELRITPVANVTGDTVVTVTVSDGILEAEMSFAIVFVKPPVISELPASLELKEDQEAETRTFKVEDGTPVQVQVSDPSLVKAEISGPPWVLTLTPEPDAAGQATVTVYAKNEYLESKHTVAVTIPNDNDAPKLTKWPTDVQTDEDVPVNVDLVFEDPDLRVPGSNETHQVTVAPTTPENPENPATAPVAQVAVLGSGTQRTLRVMPYANRVGTTSYTVTVKDRDGLKDSKTFTVTVNEVDDPPVIHMPDKPIMDEDQGPTTYVIKVYDPDSPGPVELKALSLDVPIKLDPAEGGAWYLTVTPNENQSGDVHITLTATSGGLTTEAVLRIHIREINDPPVLTLYAAEVTTYEDTSYALDMTVKDPETDLAKLRVTAVSDNPTLFPPSSFSYVVSGEQPLLTITPAPDQHGEAEITVTVSDGFIPVSRSFYLKVIPVADAPRLLGIDDNKITLDEDKRFDQQVQLYDPDEPGSPVSVEMSYTGSVLSCKENVTCEPVRLEGSGQYRRLVVEPTPDASGEGTITLALTTSDKKRTASVTIDVTVRPVNDAPFIGDILSQQTREDEILSGLQLVIGDVDTSQDKLHVTAASSNQQILKNSNIIIKSEFGTPPTLTAIPEADRFGEVTVTVTVTDDLGAKATKSFRLTVRPVNDAPSFTAGADQTVDEDAGRQTVKGWAKGISAGPYEQNQKLTFEVTTDSPDLFAEQPAVAADGTLTYTTAPNASGTAKVSLRLVDDGGVEEGCSANCSVNTSAWQSFTITVNPVNDAPEISPIPTQGTEEGVTTRPIPFTVSDVDSPVASLRVEATSSNPLLVPNDQIELLPQGGGNWTIRLRPVAGKIGTATITLKVIDTAGASTQSTFDLIVNNLRLSSLEPSVGTMSPTFSPDILAYNVVYSGYVPQVNITATVTDPGVRIKVDGRDVPTGQRSQPVALGANGGDVDVVVYSSATGIEKPYTLHFQRAQSTVAELADLSISPGQLQPNFKPEVTHYSATVPHEVTEVAVNARPGDSWSKVVIDGNTNLRVGSNTIRVTVTAENGAQSVYIITVTREPGPLTISPVEAETGADWATLRFTTNDAASIAVFYRAGDGPEQSRSFGYGTNHSVTLSGLESATGYLYRIQASRSNGSGAEVASAFQTGAAEAKGPCQADGLGLTCPASDKDVAQAVKAAPQAVEPDEVAAALVTDLDMGSAVARALADEAPAVVVRMDQDRPVKVALLEEAAVRRAVNAGLPVVIETESGSVALPPELLAEILPGEQGRLAVTLAEGEIAPANLEPWLDAGGYRQVAQPLTLSIATIDARGRVTQQRQLPSPVRLTIPLDDSTAANPMLSVFGQPAGQNVNVQPVGGRVLPDGSAIVVEQSYTGNNVVLAYEARFVDVPPSHWAYDVVHEMAARQVLRGRSATHFDPQAPVTRGQLAAILVRALNLGSDERFARIYQDISLYDPMAAEIGGAIRAGLMAGYPDGTFRPNVKVSRQEFAVVLSRMAERLNLPGTIDRETAERLARMADWSSVAPWAQDGVRYAVAEGLMTGRSAQSFAPTGETTRAEAATVVKRLLDKVNPTGEW